MSGKLADAIAAAKPSGSQAALTLWLALSVCWLLTILSFQRASAYGALGPLSLGVLAAIGLLRAAPLRRWLRPSLTTTALGVGSGLAMTALTYPAFELAAGIYPPIVGEAAALYNSTRPLSPLAALAWLGVIIMAEEALWRGVLFEDLCFRMPRWAAAALSIVAYSLAQAGTGSWLVFGLALTCGTLWLGLRAASGSLIPPLLAHAIWTPTVLLFWPVV